MKVDLNGKTALVTGAAQGIGQAIADALAANGATVIYTDREEPALQQAVADAPGAAHAMTMDVTDEAAVTQVIKDVESKHDRLDILVNNAGINTFDHRVTINEFPHDEWQRILDVDLTGLFRVSRIAAAGMIRNGSGRIVNIASVAGIVPIRLQCAFTAAKAGVVNLTRTMAIELGDKGILTNCVAPGSTLTQGTEKLFYGPDGKFSDKAQRLLDHIPLGRPGTVHEIAHAVLFLVAPEAGYINGAILPVDGGWTSGYMRDF